MLSVSAPSSIKLPPPCSSASPIRPSLPDQDLKRTRALCTFTLALPLLNTSRWTRDSRDIRCTSFVAPYAESTSTPVQPSSLCVTLCRLWIVSGRSLSYFALLSSFLLRLACVRFFGWRMGLRVLLSLVRPLLPSLTQSGRHGPWTAGAISSAKQLQIITMALKRWTSRSHRLVTVSQN